MRKSDDDQLKAATKQKTIHQSEHTPTARPGRQATSDGRKIFF
jgi:hypothetical protein